MLAEEAGASRIEQHTIYQIPLDQRHGKAWHLFTLWFGANMQVLAIVTGALSTTVFHQSFVFALLAIVTGNLVGAIFMALHAAQGPALGVPQMVQTRGQFGVIGASFVVAIVVFMYIGYFASTMVIGGQALHAVFQGVDDRVGLIVIGLASLAATIYGHDLIHVYTRLMTYVSGAALLLCFVWIVLVTGLPADFMSRGGFSWVGFFGMISVGALWQISYAPYVSDYSRYLPPGTGPREAFWASYWGCTLGSILTFLLGALIGILIVGDDIVGGLAALTGPASPVIVVLFALGVAAACAMNLYCGALSAITFGQTFLPRWKATSVARTVISVVMFLLAVLIAILGEKNFLVNYTHFIDLLLYVLVPWTAVNLVDFYLVQHGDYDVDSFLAADGGIYGLYNWPALFCYFLGILIQIPFIASDLYTGPIAAALGGVDISWVVGLAVISPIYYFVARFYAERFKVDSPVASST
jgi:NCS1 family nucleobase:cation symporter-1